MKIFLLLGLFISVTVIGFYFFDAVGLLVSFTILALAVLGTWTYRDAKSKGLNAGLWTAIVLLVPNFIGLIIYFLVARKEEVIKCNNCNSLVPRASNYCMSCGSELKEFVGNYKEVKQKNTNALMIGFIIYFMVTAIIFMVFAYTIFADNSSMLDRGISIGSIENNVGDKWSVSYISSSKIFSHSIKIKNSEPKTLYIDSENSKGELSLRLVQGDIERTIDLSPEYNTYEFDLSIFDDGEVKLY